MGTTGGTRMELEKDMVMPNSLVDCELFIGSCGKNHYICQEIPGLGIESRSCIGRRLSFYSRAHITRWKLG